MEGNFRFVAALSFFVVNSYGLWRETSGSLLQFPFLLSIVTGGDKL